MNDTGTVASTSLFIPVPGDPDWFCPLHFTKHEYLQGMNPHNLIWSQGKVFNHIDVLRNTEFIQKCVRSTTISSEYHTQRNISAITLHPLDPIRGALY